jgi:ubiquinone/menaquinone biosynthesis C-methylase UbiE
MLTQGYVTDTNYTDNFFQELSPVWLNYVAALMGAVPRRLDVPFTYLELGCGFGSSTVVNAGALPHGEFHACDFNPAHIEGGRRHAAALGISNIHFHLASFDQLLSLDLPSFDFIALHGVYSWVGTDARRAIRAVIRRMLKAGGLVYVSYNCLPGWSAEAPLRKLLVELSATAGGGSGQRTHQALRTLQQLSRSKLRYFNANPAAIEAVEAYAKRPSGYLAHEFLNETWEPFYSIDVADEMLEAEVHFLGSATLPENHTTLAIGTLAAAEIAKLPTERQRQLAVDFAMNQRFRRDVFVRGRANLGQAEISRHLDATVIGSLGRPERMPAQVKVPRGEVRFQEDFVADLRPIMLRGSTTIGEAVSTLRGDRRDATEIARNLVFLVAAGTLTPFAQVHRSDGNVTRRRLAKAVVERAIASALDRRGRRVIPSEVLGNGVVIQPVEALALTEWVDGADGVEDLATRLEAGINRLRLKIPNEGKDNGSGKTVAEYARTEASNAVEELLPTFSRLGLLV